MPFFLVGAFKESVDIDLSGREQCRKGSAMVEVAALHVVLVGPLDFNIGQVFLLDRPGHGCSEFSHLIFPCSMVSFAAFRQFSACSLNCGSTPLTPKTNSANTFASGAKPQ